MVLNPKGLPSPKTNTKSSSSTLNWRKRSTSLFPMERVKNNLIRARINWIYLKPRVGRAMIPFRGKIYRKADCIRWETPMAILKFMALLTSKPFKIANNKIFHSTLPLVLTFPRTEAETQVSCHKMEKVWHWMSSDKLICKFLNSNLSLPWTLNCPNSASPIPK